VTSGKFDAIVKARANERVQEKIKAFKIAVVKALWALGDDGKLFNPHCLIESHVTMGCATLTFLEAQKVVTLPGAKQWDAALWQHEQEKVEAELLGVMDEMQKALVAAGRAPNPDDAQPAENKETK